MTRMLFSHLLAGLPQARRLAAGDPTVVRVQCDSRHVGPGDLFVAVAGSTVDGHRYLADAVARGAVALIVERPEAAPAGVPAACVADGRDAVARLAHQMVGNPTEKLIVCGVTGTNGKTTTTYLAQAILNAAGHRTGLLGTISYQVGSRDIPAATTTPGPVDLANYFAEMVREGYDAAIMEVSSHALDQRRTAGIDFRVAAFTNLTPEHLDYHQDLPSYRAAKSLLFAGLAPGAAAVLNRDDAASQIFAEATPAERVIWYSSTGPAEVCATDVVLSTRGSRFLLHLGDQAAQVSLSLIGGHNVTNALTASGMALTLGVDPQAIVAGLEAVKAVPGRLEPVESGQPFAVLVDFAHTDDALENCLRAARPLAKGRVIAVFGCGGDRDRTKRPRMARVAERLADLVLVTNDNPRTENPEAIADEIFTGFERPAAVVRELNRAAAIRQAVALARDGDVIVLAGKGHEPYQIIGTTQHEFDDRCQAREALAALGYGGCAAGDKRCR